MTNKEIAGVLKTAAALLDLHEADPYKVKAYAGPVFGIERAEKPLSDCSAAEFEALGLKKSAADKVSEILQTGSLAVIDELAAQTPKGILNILTIKGLGAKKVRVLWKEAGIDSVPALKAACEAGTLAEVKGFGAKTQENILAELAFLQKNEGWVHMDAAEKFAGFLCDYLSANSAVKRAVISGETALCREVVQCVQICVESEEFTGVHRHLDACPELATDRKNSSPFVWRGRFEDNDLQAEIKLFKPADFWGGLLRNSAAEAHLAAKNEIGESLLSISLSGRYESEAAVYEAAGFHFVPAEMRETGTFELIKKDEPARPVLTEMSDLRGMMHAHSTWSDGRHSLREMAEKCRDAGYDYLGITDHSQTAFYANGLDEDRIALQQAEIDVLNKELAPFRIFKGIESDILGDGSLDYPDEVLRTFDFVIASVHSNLGMNPEKATERLLAAVRNPYTTILGHPTGRLLLRREGYRPDMQLIIDACAENNVSIEINANPKRLDLDWRYVRYALEKGVKICLSPDAHASEHYEFMRFGLQIGRKGGLDAESTLNTLTVSEIEKYFQQKRKA